MWGAGLSFHRCHAELNVPVDPYLDNVFDGEEGSRGIRFFTHGYDVYTPDHVLVTHDYHTHQSNPVVHTWGTKTLQGNSDLDETTKFTDEMRKARGDLQIFGQKRVNMLLGIGPEDYASKPEYADELAKIRYGRFGLGTKRTLQQAAEFTGIDLLHRKMVQNKCGNLIWVPFEASEEYGLKEVLSRGLAGGHVDPILPTFPRQTATTFSEIKLANESSEKPWLLGTGILLAALVVARLFSFRLRRKGERHMN